MRRSAAALAFTSIVVPLLTQAAPEGDLIAPLGPSQRVPGQYIVLLQNNADAERTAQDLARAHGGKLLHSYKHAVKGLAVTLPDDQVESVRRDPRVAMVSPDYEVSILQNDRPSVTSQWHWGSMGLPSASSQTLPTGVDRINAENKANKGAGIEVAILDTGIDTAHPDLKANILGGKACNGTSYKDQNGHGTHVAGTIAALENSTGVVGVAPQAKLWSVRVLNASGYGTWSSIICGIDWVTANASHIKIVNMSLGGGGTSGPCGSDPLHQAICNSVNAGVTYVVAAGNSAADLQNSVPAAYPEVIAVTALADSNGRACGGGAATSYGADDTFASFSNYASLPQDLARTIGAPGVGIPSTWKSKSYKTISGTSMATPHVAGAAALYLSTHPGASTVDVLAGLLSMAEPGNADLNGECTGGTSHVGTPLHPEPVLRADAL